MLDTVCLDSLASFCVSAKTAVLLTHVNNLYISVGESARFRGHFKRSMLGGNILHPFGCPIRAANAKKIQKTGVV